MSDRRSENTYLIQTAAEKANVALGNRKINKKHLLSTNTGSTILEKYEESETNRDNSFKDPLTGLLNRRGILEEFKLEVSTRERLGAVGGNVLIALDFIGLKKINVEKGMVYADTILKRSAESLKAQIRKTDLCGRWGGDEFLLVLFGANDESAKKTIESIIQNSPDNVHYNIGYQMIDSKASGEIVINEIMNRLDSIKNLGLTDATNRSAGTGVVVNLGNT